MSREVIIMSVSMEKEILIQAIIFSVNEPIINTLTIC